MAKKKNRRRFRVSFWVDVVEHPGEGFAVEAAVTQLVDSALGAAVKTENHGNVTLMDAGNFGAEEISLEEV